jgi:hypothetical protein
VVAVFTDSLRLNGVPPNDSIFQSFLSVASINLYDQCSNCLSLGYDYIYFTTAETAKTYTPSPTFYPASYQEARNGFISCQVSNNQDPPINDESSFASKYNDLTGTLVGYVNYQSLGRVAQLGDGVDPALTSFHTLTNAVIKINATTFDVSFVPVTLVANTPSGITTTISNVYTQEVFT